MDKIAGQGCPSIALAGVVGQLYENTDTGDVYELQSVIQDCNGNSNYFWQLAVRGDRIEKHAAIFGGDSGGADGGILLWENPNPTTRVDEGDGLTINLNFADYPLYHFLFRRSAADSAVYSGWMRSGDETVRAIFSENDIGNGGNLTIRTGKIEGYVDGNSITFWGAEFMESVWDDTSKRFNSVNKHLGDYMIPVAVIGHKWAEA